MSAERAQRKQAPEVIIVINALTGESLGRIGNVSEGGVMIISTRPIKEGAVIQIQFLLRDLARVPQRVELGVQCLWNEKARSDRSYWNGCRFVAVGEAEDRIIKDWLARLPS